MGLEAQIPIQYVYDGSNGARFLSADFDGRRKRTFVYKTSNLHEDFGVPRDQGAKREQLAYLLDKDHQACIPPTFYVDFRKFGLGIGSIQQYIESPCFEVIKLTCELLPCENLHLILIYNLAIVNLDTQVLVDRNRRYFSIDHGYSLPEKLERLPLNEMMCREMPFSEREKRYIRSLSSEHFSYVLKKHGISERAIHIQQIALQILKAAIETPNMTLCHLRDLFTGYYVPGGYSGYGFVRHRPELQAMISLETSEERTDAIQKIFARMLEQDKERG